MRVNILPVGLGMLAILNGKLGAAVQASQTQDTFFFDPYGFSVFQPNGLSRTDLLAQAAANAALFHMKVSGPPGFGMIKGLGEALCHE